MEYLFGWMGKEQFLVVFGGVLFGLATSFYLRSYTRLIRKKSFFKEKLYLAYSFGFFILTLIDWYITYDVVQYIGNSIGHYLLTFVEIGFLFIISGIINPDSKQKPGWNYLKERTGIILVLTTVATIWGLFVPYIFAGIPFIIHPGLSLLPIIFLAAYLITKRTIIAHLFLIYIYGLNIYFIILLS